MKMLFRFKFLLGVYLLATVLVLLGAAYLYIHVGGFEFWAAAGGQSGSSASSSGEWSNFGTFFGGVAGPSLAALGSLTVVIALLAQMDALAQSANQTTIAIAQQTLGWARERLHEELDRPATSGSARAMRLTQEIARQAAASNRALPTAAATELTRVAPEVVDALSVYVELLADFHRAYPAHAWPLRMERRFCVALSSALKKTLSASQVNAVLQIGHIDNHLSMIAKGLLEDGMLVRLWSYARRIVSR